MAACREKRSWNTWSGVSIGVWDFPAARRGGRSLPGCTPQPPRCAVRRETLHTSLGTLVEKFPSRKSPGGVQESAFPEPPLKLLMHGLYSRGTVSAKNHELRVRKTWCW